MQGWLWLEPAIPFASALVLLTAGRRLGRRVSAWLACGAVAAALVIALGMALGYSAPFTQIVWQWIALGSFHPAVALYLDPLAVVMTLVVTFVGLLIHVYSTQFMEVPIDWRGAPHGKDEGYERFFGYMNLFVAAMLTLVLASNLLLLLLGWEGVGLCSYLLIGFWYDDEANGRAGRKAFIVTRVGDTALIVGLLLLFTRLGTLDIQTLMQRAAANWHVGAPVAEMAAFLLLGGAVGKSAQWPLQTWLPDAMAGPTPTSALIHAATMVTAGVYLIARTHVLFALAPVAEHWVAGIGLGTLLLAGCSALVQTDMKRILAYSTISQIGYMFLALGVGAWSAAIFHLVTHAFFKALLFLAAGVVIQAVEDEHDIFKMGGLRERMPFAFWCFVFSGASLAGLPLVTAGFYSKGLIIWSAWAAPGGSAVLWAGALLGALLTALYLTRLIVVAFYGGAKLEPARMPGPRMQWPMAVLAYGSMVAGFINLAPALGGREWLGGFLAPVLPLAAGRATGIAEIGSEVAAAVVFFAGVYFIWMMYGERRLAPMDVPWLRGFWFHDWGMDWVYERALVRPTVELARWNRDDGVDRVFAGIGAVCGGLHRGLSRTVTGETRRYAGWVTAGAIALVLLAVWL